MKENYVDLFMTIIFRIQLVIPYNYVKKPKRICFVLEYILNDTIQKAREAEEKGWGLQPLRTQFPEHPHFRPAMYYSNNFVNLSTSYHNNTHTYTYKKKNVLLIVVLSTFKTLSYNKDM